jgi:hypothetical protein
VSEPRASNFTPEDALDVVGDSWAQLSMVGNRCCAPYALALFDVDAPFIGLVLCPYCGAIHSHFMRTIEPRLVRAPCTLVGGGRPEHYVLRGAPVETVFAALENVREWP